MRRQLKCIVGLLFLLAALSFVAVAVAVATARRELPQMAAIGDDGGRQDDVRSSGTAATAAAAEGGEEDATTVVRRRKDEAVKTNGRRFRSRSSSWKMPAASQVNFGGRPIPFTADYHSVHRHPPTHN